MEFEFHTETEHGVEVASAFHATVAEAYDSCAERFAQAPGARAIHIYCEKQKLHTVLARSGVRAPA